MDGDETLCACHKAAVMNVGNVTAAAVERRGDKLRDYLKRASNVRSFPAMAAELRSRSMIQSRAYHHERNVGFLLHGIQSWWQTGSLVEKWEIVLTNTCGLRRARRSSFLLSIRWPEQYREEISIPICEAALRERLQAQAQLALVILMNSWSHCHQPIAFSPLRNDRSHVFQLYTHDVDDDKIWTLDDWRTHRRWWEKVWAKSSRLG